MCRVLIIDDEEDVVKVVERRLSREGYKVESACNAEEGCSKIASTEKAYDVIITDMSMENPTAGIQVLQAAFARDLFAEVVVMTAFGNVDNAVECMRRGAFDYIEKNKPGVDAFEVLVEKIGLAMDQRRHDFRTVSTWERAAKAQKKRIASK